MNNTTHVENLIPKIDSPEKIYELFHSLGYPKDKILDPSYKRKIEEYGFAKEEREKVKSIYTVFNYDCFRSDGSGHFPKSDSIVEERRKCHG
jgi:hypothetical protein